MKFLGVWARENPFLATFIVVFAIAAANDGCGVLARVLH